MASAFTFKVKGQQGTVPSLAFGTATLFDNTIKEAVKTAVRLGYRHIDTALLYNNQEAIGDALEELFRSGDVKREDLFITTKVAFFPPDATASNIWVPLSYHSENRHGYDNVIAGADLCLKKLRLEYVDMMLIHNPATEIQEYMASMSPHLFELDDRHGVKWLAGERELIIKKRLESLVWDEAKAEAIRAESWKALEAVRAAGKAKYIGVSNYPVHLMKAMETYATVMPAMNELELHPRFSSPALQRHAKENGYLLMAYGSGNSQSVKVAKPVAEVAARIGVHAVTVVLKWTHQLGVVAITRTATESNMRAGLAGVAGKSLTGADMAALSAINEAHPYYWSPMTCQPPGSKPDL